MNHLVFGILFFAIVPLSSASERSAGEGGEVGNGGQDVALEFTTYGADVTNLIERNFHPGADACQEGFFSDLCGLDILNLRNAVRMARVISLPGLTQVDKDTGKTLTYVALNFPQDQRILVSELEWRKQNFCYVKKLPIVLHEYLGLLGVEIQNYRYSSLLLEWFRETAPDEKFQGCPELRNKGD